MENQKYDSVYEIKKAQIKAVGGDDTLPYDSVYSAELELLRLLKEGGGGGGAAIDDNKVSKTTTFSSEKIVPNITYDWVETNTWRWFGPTIDLFALYDETQRLNGPKHTEVVIQPDNFWFEIDQWPFGYDHYVDTREGDQCLCVVRVRVIIKNNPHAAEQSDFAFAEVYLIPVSQDELMYSTWWAPEPTTRYTADREEFIDGNRQGIKVIPGERENYDNYGWRSVENWAEQWSTPDCCLTVGMQYYHYQGVADPYNLQQDMFQSNPIVGMLGMVENKADGYINYSDNNTSENTDRLLFPKWNKAGIITGARREADMMLTQFNDGDMFQIYKDPGGWGGNPALKWYAPSTAGTAGQVLTSTGGEPVWKEMEDGTVFIDLSQGYTDEVQKFYSKCVAKRQVLSCQIKVDNGDGSTAYYVPSSTRYYERNVELWLMSTEDGHSWTNVHYLITNEDITTDTTTGVFGIQQVTLSQAEYDGLSVKDPNTLYIIND